MNARVIVLAMLIVTIFSLPVFSDWTEPVPVTLVNDPLGEDWSPFLSFDGLALYFSRVISKSSYYGKIYAATREKAIGPFTSVKVLDGPLNNSPVHKLCPWVSCDNLRMYYNTQETGVGWRLKFSERASTTDPWPEGTDVIELNNLGKYLTAPKLTIDELTIFFQVLDKPGGQHDIWMATRSNRHLPFEHFRTLSEINTASNEVHPCISSDGFMLYFVSNRNGFEQIFKATRKSEDMPFSNIEQLSFLDTENTCNSFPFLTYDSKTLYFMRYLRSNRLTRDIYVSYYIPDNNY